METPGAAPHSTCARSEASSAGPAGPRPRSAAPLPSSCRASASPRPGGPLDLELLFGRRARRVLDIGFGDGEALVTNAAEQPRRRLPRYRGARARYRSPACCCSSRRAVTNVRVIARDAADVVPRAAARRKLRRRRPVLPGSVAEEAASQAAARAAAVRRRARARAEAGRPAARRDGLGRLRAPQRAKCSRRVRDFEPVERRRSVRQSARFSAADEVRAPRPAPRTRRRRSLL